EDQRLVRSRQRLPVQSVILRNMSSDEGDALGKPAMRQRDAGGSRRPQRRGDTRHHEIWDAMTRELLGLLAATPEDERVAAFEARHLEALAREADHELVDVFLRRMSCASSMMLADEDAARLAPGALEHRGRNQPVVEH